MKSFVLKQKKSSPGTMGDFFGGSVRKESDETLEKKECQTRGATANKETHRSQDIQNLWHKQPTGLQRQTKYSCTTWLISITSLPATIRDNHLWHVCLASSLAAFIPKRLWITKIHQHRLMETYVHTGGTYGRDITSHTELVHNRGCTIKRMQEISVWL